MTAVAAATRAHGNRPDTRVGPPPSGAAPPRPGPLPVAVALAPLAVLLGAARLLVRRPSVLVAATLLLACVPGPAGVSAAARVTPTDVAALGAVAVLALRVAGGDRPLAGWRLSWVPFAAVLAALAAATVAAQDVAASLPGFVRYAEVFVLVPLAVATAVRDRRDLALVAGATVAVGIGEGAIGVWQAATHTGASYAGQPVRAVGTFGALDVMGMSTVVGYAAVVALALALCLRGAARAGLLAVTGLLCVPLALSLSRGSWIATACGLAATVAVAGRRVAVRVLLCVLAAAALLLLAGPGVGTTLGERVASVGPSALAQDPSVSDRYGLWRTAVSIWTDHPLLGVGPKNFPEFRDGHAPLSVSSGSDVEDSRLAFQREPLLSPHNMYLLVLSEQGLIGLLAFGLLVGMLAMRTARRHPPTGPPPARGRRFLALAAPGLLTWTLVDFGYADIGGPSTLVLAVMFGLVVRHCADPPRRGADRAPVPLAAGPARASTTGPESWPGGSVRSIVAERPGRDPARVGRPVSVGPAGRRAPGGAEDGDESGGPGPEPPTGGVVARAAALSGALSVAGLLLGLLRDLLLASYFGATGGTDAFLVGWTVPETAAPLLIEGAMAFAMVPVFSRALARGRPARSVVPATLRTIAPVLLVLAGGVAATAPWLVRVLAPGLSDQGTAVTCMRLVSLTVLTFGLAGYLSAALRASGRFTGPAAIYLAYNVAILAAMVTLRGRLGVVSAAVGVALGSVAMVAILLPGFLRHVGLPRSWGGRPAGLAAAFVPVALFTLTRQGQVFVERFFGSSLPHGTISHLNYAQKVAQVPMVLALVTTSVTFPVLARAIAAGERGEAGRRLRTDLRVVTGLVLLAAAYLIGLAPAVIATLFQHGQFTAGDTAATAAIMRVYVLGLLGHALVGALSRPYFSTDRPNRYPAVVMAAGLLVTVVLAAVAVPVWGAPGMAGANAAGITVTAVLLLAGLRRRVSAVVEPGWVAALVGRLAVPAAGAAAVGWLAGRVLGGFPPLVVAVAGGLVVAMAFAGLALLLAPGEVRWLLPASARAAGRPPAAGLRAVAAGTTRPAPAPADGAPADGAPASAVRIEET